MLSVSQRVQPGVYTLMALSWYRDVLVQRVGSPCLPTTGTAHSDLPPSCPAVTL